MNEEHQTQPTNGWRKWALAGTTGAMMSILLILFGVQLRMVSIVDKHVRTLKDRVLVIEGYHPPGKPHPPESVSVKLAMHDQEISRMRTSQSEVNSRLGQIEGDVRFIARSLEAILEKKMTPEND